MPYSIPSEEEVRDALKKVMKRMKGVGSLKKLRKLVVNELNVKNPDFTVGKERLKKLAVRAPFINTSIEAYRKDEGGDLKGRCPVCDGKLEMTKNETIFGGSVTLGYECTECPYWTTMQRRVPSRYRFEYTEGGS